jgi:hypothetical protein
MSVGVMKDYKLKQKKYTNSLSLFFPPSFPNPRPAANCERARIGSIGVEKRERDTQEPTGYAFIA